MNNEIFLSLEEDVLDELKGRHYLSLDTAKEVLNLNKFKDRFINNSKQFDYLETEEIAKEFYKTYMYLTSNK